MRTTIIAGLPTMVSLNAALAQDFTAEQRAKLSGACKKVVDAQKK